LGIQNYEGTRELKNTLSDAKAVAAKFYEGFEKKKVGANDHTIRFDSGSKTVALKKLKPGDWEVIQLSEKHTAWLTERLKVEAVRTEAAATQEVLRTEKRAVGEKMVRTMAIPPSIKAFCLYRTFSDSSLWLRATARRNCGRRRRMGS
jgi:hypothetical protein